MINRVISSGKENENDEEEGGGGRGRGSSGLIMTSTTRKDGMKDDNAGHGESLGWGLPTYPHPCPRPRPVSELPSPRSREREIGTGIGRGIGKEDGRLNPINRSEGSPDVNQDFEKLLVSIPQKKKKCDVIS